MTAQWMKSLFLGNTCTKGRDFSMVKGISRRVVVVRPDGHAPFEQATGTATGALATAVGCVYSGRGVGKPDLGSGLAAFMKNNKNRFRLLSSIPVDIY